MSRETRQLKELYRANIEKITVSDRTMRIALSNGKAIEVAIDPYERILNIEVKDIQKIEAS